MRKLVFAALVLLSSLVSFAQTDTLDTPHKAASLPHGNDHLMIQLGYTQWAGRPDTVSTTGIPRSFNMYIMLNFPFRTNKHMSAAIGVGVGSDNMYFKNTDIRIRDVATAIHFNNVADTSHFKKYKLATSYLEVPVELRFTSKPEDDGHSFKAALGVKVGVLVSAKTRGRILLDKAGTTINDYKEKEASKRFFNSNRISLTGRVGVGHFSLFSSYQLTTLFKDGMGPVINPLVIGLTVSGL